MIKLNKNQEEVVCKMVLMGHVTFLIESLEEAQDQMGLDLHDTSTAIDNLVTVFDRALEGITDLYIEK